MTKGKIVQTTILSNSNHYHFNLVKRLLFYQFYQKISNVHVWPTDACSIRRENFQMSLELHFILSRETLQMSPSSKEVLRLEIFTTSWQHYKCDVIFEAFSVHFLYVSLISCSFQINIISLFPFQLKVANSQNYIKKVRTFEGSSYHV